MISTPLELHNHDSIYLSMDIKISLTGEDPVLNADETYDFEVPLASLFSPTGETLFQVKIEGSELTCSLGNQRVIYTDFDLFQGEEWVRIGCWF